MILVDAGALVALIDGLDEDHGRCVAALRELREPLLTVWPAVTTALCRLEGVPEGQQGVLEMLRRGTVRLAPLAQEDVSRVQELMARYRDQVMELSDAALVRIAERDGLDRIFTVDRDSFEVYRIGRRRVFRIVLGRPAARRRARRRAAGRRRRP